MSPFTLSLRDARAPLSALEVGAGAVSGATFELRAGRPVVVARAVVPLPDQVLHPNLTGANLLRRDTVVEAIRRVLSEIGRPGRIGLVLEDPVAKVSLVKLQQVPARAADLEQIIRWQVRKTAPFPIEEAQVSFAAAQQSDEGQEFVVTLARRDVVVEYETACRDAGAHAGVVDLSTICIVNAAIAGGMGARGDWLLVNVAADWASIVVLRGSNPVFMRTRGADGDGTLEDLVHQTAMYYEDRLQGSGLTRAIVRATPGDEAARLAGGLADRLKVPIDRLDAALTIDAVAPIGPTQGLVHVLAPLAGMVLRDQEVAA